MKRIAACILFGIFCSSAYSDCDSVLEANVGWTIVASKTIEGYRDPGEDKKDDFEGCDSGRVIFFMDGTVVTCNSFGYQYAYMPKAIILGRAVTFNGKSISIFKMIVDGEEYDVR